MKRDREREFEGHRSFQGGPRYRKDTADGSSGGSRIAFWAV
jgi:hypothetical protein